MKLLIQRVKKASVTINNKLFSSIGNGILGFLGVEKNDTKEQADFLINKVKNLRIFEDENNKMNLSISDINGEFLIVSQFTLCGNCKKGTRPSFDDAMNPNEAKLLYEYFYQTLEAESNLKVKTGEFGAMMEIELINDGPVTFMLEK